jgi:hypothetical protein
MHEECLRIALLPAHSITGLHINKPAQPQRDCWPCSWLPQQNRQGCRVEARRRASACQRCVDGAACAATYTDQHTRDWCSEPATPGWRQVCTSANCRVHGASKQVLSAETQGRGRARETVNGNPLNSNAALQRYTCQYPCTLKPPRNRHGPAHLTGAKCGPTALLWAPASSRRV